MSEEKARVKSWTENRQNVRIDVTRRAGSYKVKLSDLQAVVDEAERLGIDSDTEVGFASMSKDSFDTDWGDPLYHAGVIRITGIAKPSKEDTSNA